MLQLQDMAAASAQAQLPAEHSLVSAENAAAAEWLQWLMPMLHGAECLHLVNFSAAPEPCVVTASQPLDTSLPEGWQSALQAAWSPDSMIAVPLPLERQGKTTGASIFAVALPASGGSDVQAARVLLFVGKLPATSDDVAAIRQRQTLAVLVRWAAAQLPVVSSLATEGMGRQHHEALPSEPVVNPNYLQLLARTPEASLRRAAAMLVRHLAHDFDCQRVSVGRRVIAGKQSTLELLAISHQPRVDNRRRAARRLAAAMSECLQYQGVLVGQRADTRRTSENSEAVEAARNRAQNKLCDQSDAVGKTCISLPLLGTRQATYAFTFERDQLFSPSDVADIEGALAGMDIWFSLVTNAHTGVIERVRQNARRWLQVSFWAERPRWHWIAMVGCALSVALACMPVTHRVTGAVEIQARDRQVVTAPREGLVASAFVRPGDEVTGGAILATLDTATLELEMAKWRGESRKVEQAHAQALSVRDRAELARLRAERDRVAAELSITQTLIERSTLLAPFNAVVLSGDLTQSLGASVAAGNVLFELGSATDHRLQLLIEEADIGYVQPGQTVHIRLTSMPGELLVAEVDTLLPVADASPGKAEFRVEADPQGSSLALRPGMLGVAKIDVGKRALAWTLTHKFWNQLRLLSWRIGLIR